MKPWLLLAAAVLISGCGTFSKPPLPKSATGEVPQSGPGEWSASLRRADVIYSSLTKSEGAENQPTWRIVETFQAGGARVALGWTELPVSQQLLFDQWQRQEISAEQLVDQLGAPRPVDWIRRALRPDLLQVALGSPRELLRKIRAGDQLTADERALLPKDYRPRPEAFDNFTDRVSTSTRLRRYDPANLYRAHLAAEQMIAENIVQFLRAKPGVKLIVFLPNDVMIDPREVADYVAQKASPQQLILDRAGPLPGTRPQLLARGRGNSFEIIDRAPESSRHDRRLSTPRLRA